MKTKHLDPIISFSAKEEPVSTAVSWRLESGTRKGLRDPSAERVLFHESDGAIDGIVYLNRSGLILPLFKDRQGSQKQLPPDSDMLRPLFRRYLHSVHSIMGRQCDVTSLNPLIGQNIRKAIDYHFLADDRMEKTEIIDRVLPGPPQPEIEIHRAKPTDTDKLFELHKGYEMEEVLLDPDSFNPTASMMQLKRQLQEQIVFYGTIGKTPITKAGTNAIGWRYAQIGGVYTVPEYRRRGYAAQVVRSLMALLEKERRLHSCLFVKKRNRGATELYRALGFEEREQFRITYYHPH